MNDRERLRGVADTLVTLADGLVRDGFIDPEDDEPDADSILEELADDVGTAQSDPNAIQRLPLLLLQVVRVADAAGVRPTVASSEGGAVSVNTMDIAGGLEILEQAPKEANLELRGIATAVSVLLDYAHVVVEGLLAETEQEGLDRVSLSRGAVTVAEISIRKALTPEARAELAVGILRRCADNIEAEAKGPEGDAGEEETESE